MSTASSTTAVSSNHSPFRRVHRANYAPPLPSKTSSSASSTAVPRHYASASAGPGAIPAVVDTCYGHENISKLCARFVSHTFNCPEIIPLPTPAPSSNTNSTNPNAPPPLPPLQSAVPNDLTHFVAYALHRTRLPPSVVFTALALLHRLKARFPTARGSSGHRLFLAAYILASKVVCDDTYSNKPWAVVCQGMFTLREINQMEREMLRYLEWGLNVCREDLVRFECEVRRVYAREGGAKGRGVEMRLSAGVGGYPAREASAIEKLSSLTLLNIPPAERANPQHQLQPLTPTDTGPVAVPVAPRPVLPPISTMVVPGARPAYPSLPSSPSTTQSQPSVTVVAVTAERESACSSPSTSPVDGDDYEERESPSPASSEDSDALPTPPNSALTTHAHAHAHAHAQRAQKVSHPHSDIYRSASALGKLGKAHSVPDFQYFHGVSGGMRMGMGRASAPPSAASASVGVYPSIASINVNGMGGMRVGGMEGDEDAVMSGEMDESGAYYATAVSSHSHAQRKSVPALVSKSGYNAREGRREDGCRQEEGRREERRQGVEGKEEREERREEGRKDERRMRAYTVPCAW